MRKSVVEAVEKTLRCGDISKGYTKYRCIECHEGHETIIGRSRVEEFIWWEEMDEEYAETKECCMPTWICPKCNGMLKSKKR